MDGSACELVLGVERQGVLLASNKIKVASLLHDHLPMMDPGRLVRFQLVFHDTKLRLLLLQDFDVMLLIIQLWALSEHFARWRLRRLLVA